MNPKRGDRYTEGVSQGLTPSERRAKTSEENVGIAGVGDGEGAQFLAVVLEGET